MREKEAWGRRISLNRSVAGLVGRTYFGRSKRMVKSVLRLEIQPGNRVAREEYPLAHALERGASRKRNEIAVRLLYGRCLSRLRAGDTRFTRIKPYRGWHCS